MNSRRWCALKCVSSSVTLISSEALNISKVSERFWLRGSPSSNPRTILSVFLLLFLIRSVSAQGVVAPTLISQQTSTRAIAFESVTFTTEPFQVNSELSWNVTDSRTRILLFVLNLTLQPDDSLSFVTGDGEDANHRHYSLSVEYLGAVPHNEWMSAVILRLDNRLGDVGDLLIRLSYRGVSTNRVRVGIGHVGGGLPDDPGALPTPAPPYQIQGHVTKGGKGVAGVILTLTGSTTSGTTVDTSTLSGEDGSYVLLAPAAGTYIVTPSMPQRWYTITPTAKDLSISNSDQTVDFSATLQSIPNPFYVLEFDASPKSVVYTPFWQQDVNLGHFFWEFWAQPGPKAGATYMLTDGYGGAHALLFGFGSYNTSERNRYELLGNIFDGVKFDNYFGSDEGPAVGEWGHFAVGWDGQNIVTYFNGVPVGKAPFAGPRRTPGPAGGGGRLMIGGSDHSNFDGRIAQVRGFEGSNPREAGGVEAAFVPETLFPMGTGNLLSYFFQPGTIVADLSSGYDGAAHIGFVRGTAAGILYDCGDCPPPKFVLDPSAPGFLDGSSPQPVQVPNPVSIPTGSLVFDSFSRPNSTYLFGGSGGLGSTEGGSEGGHAWQMSQDVSGLKPFGILNGRAVLLGNSRHVAWINTRLNSGNLQVSVERLVGHVYGAGWDTGLSFRVIDAQNYFFAYTSANGSNTNPRVLTLGYYQNNQRTDLAADLVMPSTWTTLRVNTKTNGTIQVFADNTLIISTNHSLNASAAGIGIYNNATGLGLVNRWDNFTASELP